MIHRFLFIQNLMPDRLKNFAKRRVTPYISNLPSMIHLGDVFDGTVRLTLPVCRVQCVYFAGNCGSCAHITMVPGQGWPWPTTTMMQQKGGMKLW